MLHKRAFIAMVSERLVAILEHIGASSLIFLPTARDAAVPELEPLINLYGRGKGVTAAERTRLCRLAWELTGGSFGGRHQLYERLHSGDPATMIATAYERYDKSRGIEMVRRLLEWAD
jgi:4-hydroxyphenylacetate 3-monooxygenase